MFARTLVFTALALSTLAAPHAPDSGLAGVGSVIAGGGGDCPYPTPTATVTVTVTVGAPGGGPTGGSPPPPPPPPATTTSTPASTPTGGSGSGSGSGGSGGSGSGGGSGNGSGSGSGSGAVCNTGPVQCCNQIQPANSVNFASILPSSLLGLLPINIQGLNVPVGLTCDPINVLGIGGNSCSQQTVCCENNNFSGLVAIGCTPINIGL